MTGAREDWERRIYQRTDAAGDVLALRAPQWVRAEPGVGHIRLSWDSVPGAAGYLIERSDGDDVRVLEHGGSDVAAVPATSFADTGLADDGEYGYRIGAVAGAGQPVHSWSDPVYARPGAGRPGTVRIAVDAGTVIHPLHRVWSMVGSERLSQLGLGVDAHGHDIGAEFEQALRLAHDDLGVTHVRAHAILHDDVGVARRGADGRLEFTFDTVDAIYDQLLSIGVRPVVELSFMPAALARDPQQTVFEYRAIISPPSDWAEWRALVAALTAHLVERYGIEEIAQWAFEIWNEPNLAVFWTGSRDDYLRLYDEAVAAIKGVDARLTVGGPSTSAGEWVEALAAHAADGAVPLDFVSTHTYGNLPVDLRPALERHGFGGLPVWWTEWGVGHAHFGPVHDAVLGAPFVLSGFAAVQGRLDALAYWVISDHFEELGRPKRLFHDGFGLLSVGNLRKPRYWAVHLAAHQGDQVLASRVEGDGADVLVQAWATRHDDGTVDVLAWNGTINSDLMDGDARLDRSVGVTVAGLDGAAYQARIARVDEQHSNVVARCPSEVDWPDDALWQQLHADDVLAEQGLGNVVPDDGAAHFDFDLPMPGVVRVRLTPEVPGADEENAS